jgi:outer membrane protein TolC
VDVVKESLRISGEYEKQVHEAVTVGIAFKGDELRARGQSERYEIDLRQAAEQQRLLAASLAEILHLGPETALEPDTAELVPAHIAETNATLDSLVQRALINRPHLKETQALVSAAREARDQVVYGPMIPSVGAQAVLGGLGGGKNGSTGNFSDSEDYGLGIGWRIGPGGLFDSARIRTGDARFEMARLETEKLTDQIIREVVQAHARVQSLQEQLSFARQNLETSSETLRLARERKEFAVGAVLEDIQAQQDLTRARTSYLNAVTDYLRAQYALLHAIGAPQAPK